MIAAIVVPAGVRSIAMIRACLVSGRIAVFEDEGANRMRVLDLLVDREVERTAAFGLDLGLVMGSSEVRATRSAAPPQPRRANHPAGRDPLRRLGRTQAGIATLRSRTKASHFCTNSRTLHVQCRSFLRTRLYQWLSLRMIVLKIARAVSLFKLIAVLPPEFTNE